jgi:hypothetical protein
MGASLSVLTYDRHRERAGDQPDHWPRRLFEIARLVYQANLAAQSLMGRDIKDPPTTPLSCLCRVTLL